MSAAIRQRTCIATRNRCADTQLLRVCVDAQATAARSGEQPPVTVIAADPGRVLPGRGAWITPTLAAVEQAVQRRAFQRALRLSTRIDVSGVTAEIARRQPGGVNNGGVVRYTKHK